MSKQDHTKRALLPTMLALVLALPALAAAAPRRSESQNLCLINPTGGGSYNTFVFQEVAPLAPGQAVAMHGIYFNGTRRATPLSGTAAMATDGSVRLGIFVHSSAVSTSTVPQNDFTLAGVGDASFAGLYYFDNDGDFKPNGTLAIEPVDCSTIEMP
jgi:hypothetical protein